MKVIDQIGSVLRNKGSQILSITPEATVFEAIQIMAEKNVGALLVISQGRLVGVISERDYTRKVALKGKSSRQTQVREILSGEIISVTSCHTVEDCMRLMTDKRIRHLPVLEGENIVGIVSIGDLVNWIISAQSRTIDQLESYIAGRYPG
jgi:CBS domain-containing protein